MTVYLDLVMVLNFLVDYFLLLGTNRLSGFPPGAGRCALGAVVGAVYSGACMLPGFRFLGNPLWRLVSLGLMCVCAFDGGITALRRGTVFVILSMAMGGIALRFGRGEFLSLLLCGGILWLLCRLGFGEGKQYVPIAVTYAGKTVNVLALQDTGNTLKDPVTGEPVLVLSAAAAGQLTGLSEAQIANPLETLAQRPIAGLRLIPYRAVGSGGMLLAMRFSQVRIGNKRKSALVAFAPAGSFDQKDVFQALTGGVL